MPARRYATVIDVTQRIAITALLLVIYRLGATIPLPGLAVFATGLLHHVATKGILGAINVLSGGALAQAAILTLGVMPMVTSQLILQLLRTVVPKLSALEQSGQAGQRRIAELGRWLALAVAVVQGIGVAALLHHDQIGILRLNLLAHSTLPWMAMMVLTLVAGSVLVTWLADLISRYGIGPGVPVLLLISVVSGIPPQIQALLAAHQFVLLTLLGLGVVGLCVVVTAGSLGERRLLVGDDHYPLPGSAAAHTYLPIRPLQAGIVPVLFASYFLSAVPSVIGILPPAPRHLLAPWFAAATTWPSIALLAMLVLAWSYVYAAVAFSPLETSEDLARNGQYLSSYAPGPPTILAIADALGPITIFGGIVLAILAVLPDVVARLDPHMPLAVTAIPVLISTLVVLDLRRHVRARASRQSYKPLVQRFLSGVV